MLLLFNLCYYFCIYLIWLFCFFSNNFLFSNLIILILIIQYSYGYLFWRDSCIVIFARSVTGQIKILTSFILTSFFYFEYSISKYFVSCVRTYTPDGRSPGRAGTDFTSANSIARNGRPPATLCEPIRANPRHQARICGASTMWVRRAAQRAEPGAPQDIKGEPRAGW